MSHVHLNGSLNLDSADAVFSMVGELLGDHVLRLPDGETTRKNWAPSLVADLHKVAQIEPVGVRQPDAVAYGVDTFTLRPGCSPDDVDFGPVEFADTALAGYRAFCRTRRTGVLPADTRFQVSLPTPTAVIAMFFEPRLVGELLPRFAEHLRRELARLLEDVPALELAVQWDVAPELAFIPGDVPGFPDIALNEITGRLRTLASFVPDAAELGFHLCYGDPHQVVVPEDLGYAVSLVNAIYAAVERPVQWFSLPVPSGQAVDDSYFRPLRDVRVGPETEIQLGLIDDADGVEGSLRRARLARRHLADFGVSTVCGMGRHHGSAIRPLLELHRAIVEELLDWRFDRRQPVRAIPQGVHS